MSKNPKVSERATRKSKKVRKRVKPKVDIPLDDPESDLIKRISDCSRVVDELESSPVWKIVQDDLEYQRQQIDDRWQEIVDPQKIQEVRVLKMATMHILNLKHKYKEELDALETELDKLRNTDKEIIKDYDTE